MRELKECGVDVWFERENIHSLSEDGEFMLTLLSAFAQEESLSASENQEVENTQEFFGRTAYPHKNTGLQAGR